MAINCTNNRQLNDVSNSSVLRSIADICLEVTSGGTPRRSTASFYEDGIWPWVKTKELADGWLDHAEEYITDVAVASSSAKILPKDTILMAMYGATVGKLGILSRAMACNQACCAMIVNPKKAHFRYLFYQLLRARPQIKRLATGAAQQNLSGELIKSLQFTFPPLPKQHAIADCLGSLDDLIAAEAQELKSLRQHKQGLMEQLFPQPGETVPRLRFPEFEGRPGWSGLPLAELEAKGKIEFGRGKVISRADMRTIPGPYPVYSSSVMDEDLMGAYGDYMFDEELISWSVDGGGHFFYRPKHKFSITNVSGFMRLLCGNIVCRFLAYQLQQLHGAQFFNYQQKAHPSVIRTLYKVGLPEPDEQQKIADCLGSLDDLITVEGQKLGALQQHKQGLMQQLFPCLEMK